MFMAWSDREGWLNCVFLGDCRVEDEKERGERRCEIIMRNWDLEEFCVGVNFPIPMQQVGLPIQHVITLMRILLNPIRQVVPQFSHFHWYPPYHSHLDPPSLFLVHISTIIAQHKVKSSLSISPCHDHAFTPGTSIDQVPAHQVPAYTEYSIHWVRQHQPLIDCHTFILTNASQPLNKASASGLPPYKIDLHQPALCERSKVKSPVTFPRLQVN